MNLSQLFQQIPYQSTLDREIDVKGISCDSRELKKGDLFFALKGYSDNGNQYIPDAIAKKALAVVTESETGFENKIPHIYTPDARLAYSLASVHLYNNPAASFYLIGITGTNGKTTTAFIIHQLFQAAGYVSGMVGTLGYALNDEWHPGRLTTPDPLLLQKILDYFRRNQTTHVVMEISSHALALSRVEGMEFNQAIYTNLSRDHLDFHSSMDEYAKTKARLFGKIKDNGFALINHDDSYADIMIKNTAGKIKEYSFLNKSVDYYWKTITITNKGIKGIIHTPEKNIPIETPLTGRFNAFNILAAVGATSDFIDAEIIRNTLSAIPPVPGRYEKVLYPGKPMIVIDYAHTPDAMENILAALKTEKDAAGRLIVVFGCGGDRDKAKRPQMGHVAELYGDIVFLTSDNPRYEDPLEIIKMAKDGILNHTCLVVEPDRREAIKKAITEAGENDVVAILGKGHETYQEIKGVRYPFDDRQVVKEIINQ